MPIRSITVYCSSSRNLAPHYYDAGVTLGRAIAECGWTLVYGGNSIGLTKSLADAVRSAGGKVIGITPQVFVDDGFDDKQCHELIVTQDMRHRKELLEQRGDAFIAMPGGIGTFEEIFEIIAGKTLGYHHKPIVLLNVAGFWDPLLAMIERGIDQGFIKPRVRGIFHVARDVPDAIAYLSGPESAGPPKSR
jgi:uncharacterized protein (TIGR00730 family)